MENEQLLGEHYLIELWGCNKLDYNKDELQRLMEEAAVICECTIVQSVFHQFNPQTSCHHRRKTHREKKFGRHFRTSF
jgi:S-adenosylmethionine/arginine decarboxylase-like enzyme